MAMDDVVVGSELDVRDFRFNVETGKFELNFGPGFARTADGPFTVDPATLATIIAPLIDPAAIAAQVAPLIPPAASTSGNDRLISHGFDAGNKTFTSSLADGTQVVAGMPDVVLAPELAARLKPLTSVSGRPVPGVMVFAA